MAKGTISSAALCAYGREAVGGGYCWGADGQTCSPAVREELARRVEGTYPGTANTLRTTCAKWDGRKVWDCSGLFRGAWRALLSYKAGGATTIYKTWCAQTGAIGAMPDEPGIAVFKAGSEAGQMDHIGLYVGGGMVVDARGSAKGVVVGPKTAYPWTHWGRLADVDYEGSAEPMASESIRVATVKTQSGGGIGLWTSPGKVTRLALIPEGAAVEVLTAPDGQGFVRVRYQGLTGYADSRYMPAVGSGIREPEPKEGETLVAVMLPLGTAASLGQAFLDAAGQGGTDNG